MNDSIVLEDVISDLKRIQDFDVQALVQEKRLGVDSAFSEVVEPAQRLVDLFRMLPADAVHNFPFQQKDFVQKWSRSAYNLFQQVLEFDVDAGSISDRRAALIEQIRSAHQNYFNHLSPLISFAVARTADFNKLAEDGRAAVQGVRDEAKAITAELQSTSDEAVRVLGEVREAAAEQGVTQMARYFGDEATTFDNAAKTWLISTIVASSALIFYSIYTFYFQLPVTVPEAVQAVSSKVLLFFVLAYLLSQCVKNYMRQRHNYVVNKHRQNALLTYTTLTEAGATQEAREVVLQHAAAAIYAPIDTGYSKSEERGYNSGVIPQTTIAPNVSTGQ